MSSADALKEFSEALAAAGLVVEGPPVADGALHRCGVAGKPRGKDGSYVIHLDAPAVCWFRNWRTGATDIRTLTPEGDMSKAERAALRERIEAIKEKSKEEKEEQYKTTAKLARILWAKAEPAPDNHPYLAGKQVPALGGLRQNAQGELLVPVRGPEGGVVSLQFILPEKPSHGPDKRFLKGGRTAGGFFAIPARDGGTDGPLLIAEGYATAASLHLATGYAVLVAFNAGNLEAVARMALERHPAREILICADNDAGREKPDGTPFNPGVEAATKAAQAAGAKLAVCPAHEGRATDFNDLHCWRTLFAVETEIEKARKQDNACPIPEGFALVPDGRGAGLYWLKPLEDGDTERVRLGPPLLVRGATRDDLGGEWGLMLEWRDPEGRPHSWNLPGRVLNQKGGNWFAELASGGWFGAPGAERKVKLFLTLSNERARRFVRCVPRIGWTGSGYVLPDTAYGVPAGSVVLQSAQYDKLFQLNGTLDGWKEIPALCAGNSRLVFALCLAFAGPLLHLAGLEGGGFSFEGGSSSGKTTSLRVAASVWGGTEHVRSWRTTDNGLEGIAALHNDNILVLDEVGQVAGRVLSEAVYMLANGSGKTRAGRESSLRRSLAWRLLFLSSGELGLADKLAEAGLRSRAGQEVRFVGIPVEASMLTALHGLPDAATVADTLKALCAEHYGHAGRAFLQWLCPRRKEMRDAMRDSLPQFASKLCPPDASEQVRRVAMRFALVLAGGIAAQEAGLLPEDMELTIHVQSCFTDWLAARGGAGVAEDAAILAQVRLCIEQHGASRFQDVDAPDATFLNRMGFRQKGRDGRMEYIILTETFRSEVVKGFSPRRAASVLRNAGWLRLSDDKNTTKRDLPGLGRVRCYVVVLPEET